MISKKKVLIAGGGPAGNLFCILFSRLGWEITQARSDWTPPQRKHVHYLKKRILDISKNMRVLEVGTGSGYQTYILSKLARFVYSVERYKSLTNKAFDLFKKLNVSNIFCKHGDGGRGWLEQAPFDRIIVTACAQDIPGKLVDQLSEKGKMIVPIGDQHTDQTLKKITKNKTTIIVSHRISSAKNADKIIVLDDGKIIQSGTHQTLKKTEGYYQDLYRKQRSEKEM